MRQRQFPNGSPAELVARLWQKLRLKSDAPSITSLTNPRKLTPIDDILARVGRDPLPPD